MRVSIPEESIIPALRDLFSTHPRAKECGPETLARMLYVFRFPPCQPDTFAVEVALEALMLEDAIAA